MMWKSLVAACIAVGLMMSVVPGSVAHGAPDEEPYVTYNEWRGFISCAVSSPFLVAFPCGMLDPNHEFIHSFSADDQLRSIVIAMSWDRAPLGADELALFVEEGPSGSSLAQATGGSPLEMRLDAGEDFEVNEETWLRFRVLPTFEPQVVYSQTFTVHYHLFYGEHAPEGYSALPQ